ncbi:MAG: hypothetical protein CMM56_08895 [Rhodospirillaceae bacterium]|nr:hypothetical protein [Rhodospirillaceae bacterium]|tara:strand:+ start:155 stop:655 length:501 start_codon:yes stop_codon:yes gene_type:complete
MNFSPMLTPKEMIHKGIFGGTYFSELVDHREFPEEWFKGLEEKFYCSKKYRSEVNLFKIKSGQSQKEWEDKGWIHRDDPRGWFEWYCKYHMGRRHEDDARQIKRWAAFCGPKGRWRNRIYSQINLAGCSIETSQNISRRIQQSLLHWSYIVNDADYRSWLIAKDGS